MAVLDQIGVDVARLHVNGGVVGERRVEYLTKNGGGGDRGPVTLFGGDGDMNGASVQGYAHYVRLLPQPTVTNHYVKVCTHTVEIYLFSSIRR